MSWTDPHTWTPGEIMSAVSLNHELRDDLEFMYSGTPSLGWIPVIYQNSWVDYDASASGWPGAQFKKIGRYIVMKGLIKNGTFASAGTEHPAFALPAGYQPTGFGYHFSAANTLGTLSMLHVSSNGNVTPGFYGSQGNGWYSVCCMFPWSH